MAKKSSSNYQNVNDPNIDKINTLDKFYRTTQVSIGSVSRPIANNLYGINHRNLKGAVPENRDSYGLTFFTRPALNLSRANLANIRKFYSLLTTNPNSVHAYVRCMLDPRISRMGEFQADVSVNNNFLATQEEKAIVKKLRDKYFGSTFRCPLVDEKLAFIPVLTNNLKSLSGFPDIVMPTYTTKEGLKREQWSIADGMIDIYEAYDIDCTFRNIKDEPIILLFETWLRYMAMVFEGMMSPYFDFIIENEIDYMTRIYRLVLDESKTFVKKMGATGVAFPVNVPNGKFFDYDDTEKYNNNNKDISIRFKCLGAEYNDDILVKEFNTCTLIFNPELGNEINSGKLNNYVKIPFNMLEYFNYRGYPLIDKNTLELCWYISTKSPTFKEVKDVWGIKFV